jgi:hypothetical protein
VDVDEARTHEESLHVDGFHRIGGVDLRCDRGDLAPCDRDITNRRDAVARINEVTALKKQLITGRRRQMRPPNREY